MTSATVLVRRVLKMGMEGWVEGVSVGVCRGGGDVSRGGAGDRRR